MIISWLTQLRLGRLLQRFKVTQYLKSRFFPIVQWFDHWIHPWITRANGVYALGCALLLQGIKHEWYHLPSEALDVFYTSQFGLQHGPRLGVAISMATGLGWLLWCWPRVIPRLPYWGGLFLVLLFPFFLTTWAPSISYLATAYNEQNLEVVRHVEKKFPEVQAQWKQNISLDQHRPVQSIFAFNIESRSFFQLSSWERVILDGFGYRNPIFDFIGKGWGMTVAGITLSLMGIYMQHRHQALQLFHRDVAELVPVVIPILITIVVYLIGVNIANHHIALEMGQGKYAEVTGHSAQLARIYPPISGDEFFLRRWAMASVHSDQSDAALVAFTQGCDRYRVGDFHNAKNYFEQALESEPRLFLARGYLAATLINEGVEYSRTTDRPKLPVHTVPFPKKNNFLDSPQSNEHPNVLRATGAMERFNTALTIFPNHVSALYDLMLIQAMNGDFESSNQTAQKHIELQNHFQKKNVALLGQAYLHRAWADYHAGDVHAAWLRYRQSRDSKTWGEAIKRVKPYPSN